MRTCANSIAFPACAEGASVPSRARSASLMLGMPERDWPRLAAAQLEVIVRGGRRHHQEEQFQKGDQGGSDDEIWRIGGEHPCRRGCSERKRQRAGRRQLSQPAHQDHRAVRPRRGIGFRRPRHPAEALGRARPADRHREPRRCRRQCRHGRGRARGPRRLYALPRQHRHGGAQPARVQGPAGEAAAGFHSRIDPGRHAVPAGRQSEVRAQQRQGADRACQGEPRQGQLRLAGLGQHGPPGDGAAAQARRAST